MTETNSADAVVIERNFDAPVDLVWQMWVVPEYFAAWYGPTGATIPVAKMDVRVGGKRLIRMEMDMPSGPQQMWFAGEFIEVVEHERLVYTEWISDENGAPAPADPPEGHPGVTEVRIEFTDAGGRTRMVMTHVGVPPDSPGATGWQMAFEKLEARLSNG
jgi:uncharacterized protein YndB with AHSA1/START domain